MSGEGVPCYVGREKCGCYVAAAVAPDMLDPHALRQTANDLAKWQKGGLTIEMSTVGAVRGGLLTPPARCPHVARQAALALQGREENP